MSTRRRAAAVRAGGAAHVAGRRARAAVRQGHAAHRRELLRARAQRLLQRTRVPPRHQGLHGADRGPHRYRSLLTCLNFIIFIKIRPLNVCYKRIGDFRLKKIGFLH